MTRINRVLSRQTVIFIAFWCFTAAGTGNCQNLIINSQKANYKEVVAFTVSVKSAPNAVQSFGFDVHFNPQVLKYSRYERGDMVKKYKFFDCAQIEPGVLRCGGFNIKAEKISAGQTGEVAVLYFHKILCRNTVLSLEDVVDDLKGWEVGKGQFFCWRD